MRSLISAYAVQILYKGFFSQVGHHFYLLTFNIPEILNSQQKPAVLHNNPVAKDSLQQTETHAHNTHSTTNLPA